MSVVAVLMANVCNSDGDYDDDVLSTVQYVRGRACDGVGDDGLSMQPSGRCRCKYVCSK